MSIMNHGCDVSITPQFDKKKKKNMHGLIRFGLSKVIVTVTLWHYQLQTVSVTILACLH